MKMCSVIPIYVISQAHIHTLMISCFLFQIAQKYDAQKEEELRFWIEEVTGMSIGENFQTGLKDGVILCE